MLVGFCINNILYINTEYDVSILDCRQICRELGYLIIRKLLYPKPGGEIELDFKNALQTIVQGRQKAEKQLVGQSKKTTDEQESQIKYNKERVYKLWFVMDKFGIIIQKCIIEGVGFFLYSMHIWKTKNK